MCRTFFYCRQYSGLMAHDGRVKVHTRRRQAGRQEDPSQISLSSSPHGVSTLYPPPGYRAVTANVDWVSWRKFDSWTPWRSRVFRINDAIQRGTREGRLPDRGEDHPKMGQRWTMEWLDPDAKRCNLPCLFPSFQDD